MGRRIKVCLAVLLASVAWASVAWAWEDTYESADAHLQVAAEDKAAAVYYNDQVYASYQSVETYRNGTVQDEYEFFYDMLTQGDKDAISQWLVLYNVTNESFGEKAQAYADTIEDIDEIMEYGIEHLANSQYANAHICAYGVIEFAGQIGISYPHTPGTLNYLMAGNASTMAECCFEVMGILSGY